MAAVLLALLSGVFLGGVAVGTRAGLNRLPDAELGALATQLLAFVVTFAIVAVSLQLDDVTWSGAWPFLALGVLVPGISQVLFSHSVKDIGASRAMIIVGIAPLAASIGAVLFLDEPLRAGLAVGTLLIVSGAIALAWDRVRPADYRAIGAVWATGALFFFALRDNFARGFGLDRDIPPTAAAAALFASASLMLLAYIVVTRRGKHPVPQVVTSLRPFAVAGVTFGLAYATLMLALDRGRVGVVAPIAGMYSLWTVVLSAIFLRRTEAISGRLVAAACLVVCGGAIVAATR